MRTTIAALSLTIAAALCQIARTACAEELEKLVAETWEDSSRWAPTDDKAWKILKADDGRPLYRLFQASEYKPPHRSPLNFALLKAPPVANFELQVRVRSTGRDYDHRDVCLIFGYQDAAHFYYAHLAKRADDHANQIFIVDGADRKKISTATTVGTPWDNDWHKLRLTRGDGGDIAVYFDTDDKPVMTAKDKTFAWGQVGLGSFDDTADFQSFVLLGKTVQRPEPPGK